VNFRTSDQTARNTAVATRLLQKDETCSVTLAGRNVKRGENARNEILREIGDNAKINFLALDYKDQNALDTCLQEINAVIHVAGPFYGEPIVLEACIRQKVSVYVDVSDPLEYLNCALAMHQKAKAAGTTAMLCAGAFPGMSNVLSVETASLLKQQLNATTNIKQLNFSYFTAGLGGSGTLNLEITNFGFGPPMPHVVNGKIISTPRLAGSNLGQIEFSPHVGFKNVWAWPFPEAATVGSELQADFSIAGMGTEPDIWNTVLRFFVHIIPSNLWTKSWFSIGLARISQPLVALTDFFLPETHAMRIDILTRKGQRATTLQSHESFRRCVGQSAAEFCLDLLYHRDDDPGPGVFLPEVRYRDNQARQRIINALTSTPGTLHFSSDVHC